VFLAGAALALAGGCAGMRPRPWSEMTTLQAWPDAAGDVADPELAALCVELWDLLLREDPIHAGQLGDQRALGEVPDVTPSGRRSRREALEDLARRAAALPALRLPPGELESLELLRGELDGRLALAGAELDLFTVDPLEGPHLRAFSLAPDQPTHTAVQRDALLRRWRALPGWIDAHAANLRQGLRRGRVANRHSIELVLGQLQRQLAQDPDEWPLANPRLAPTLLAYERRLLLEQARAVLRTELAPALARLAALLEHELLPAARGDEAPGLASLPDGPGLYAGLVRAHTSLPLTARELHDFGLAEVARIRAEAAALAERVFGAGAAAGLQGQAREDALVADAQRRLRGDPALHFSTRDEVQAKAEEALARARQAMPQAFGLLPRAPCTVVRVPAHEERETTIAYYRGPAADGTLPGRYFINTFAPKTRPRYEAEVLAFHEAIPGHHLQIAIAQEAAGLPRFRREGGSTAFVEGWALYTERLCDELSLYSGDVDRFGILSFDAWRACRLVVDTGLHAFGWSRQQAVDYLLANTLLAPNNVENEVDRYIAWPGQAVAYKAGQREILALRAEAERRLGARFDLRAFHDVVLRSGAVTLRVLRENVEEWLGAEGGG
jgi:uncharacterized protein (DUF885 family)